MSQVLLDGLCIFYFNSIDKQHTRIDTAIVVLVFKNLHVHDFMYSVCVCVCVCVQAYVLSCTFECVIVGTQVPWCTYRGQRTASDAGLPDVGPQLPPCIRQELFAICHCVYQASWPMSAQRFSCLHSPSHHWTIGITGLMWVPISGPHICMASTSLDELPP